MDSNIKLYCSMIEIIEKKRNKVFHIKMKKKVENYIGEDLLEKYDKLLLEKYKKLEEMLKKKK